MRPVKLLVHPTRNHRTVLSCGAGCWLYLLADSDYIHRLILDCGSFGVWCLVFAERISSIAVKFTALLSLLLFACDHSTRIARH